MVHLNDLFNYNKETFSLQTLKGSVAGANHFSVQAKGIRDQSYIKKQGNGEQLNEGGCLYQQIYYTSNP